MMREVDARGLPCPRPVLETKKALEAAGKDEITVLVDSPESRENVRRFAESQGCTAAVSEEDGVFTIRIAKGSPVPARQEQPAAHGSHVSGPHVVLVATDSLGTGDKKLGGILMKAFLNTLWDASPRPEKIIFMNEGVYLTTEGSDMLDTLTLLERDGVLIYSCGTCLEYYGITDKLAAGEVTNMYDTVQSLLAAGKVISI